MPSFPHPCSYSVPASRPTGTPALTAAARPDPDHAARRARHLRQCERLAELGMDLAEDAHREAKRDLQPPVQRRTPIPGLPFDYANPPEPVTVRDATFGHLFAVLSRCVRQAILLESRIAAGMFDRPAAEHPDAPPHAEPAERDPIPPAIRPYNPPRLRPEPLEDDLAADAQRSAPEILAGICAELGHAIDAGLTPGRRPLTPRIYSLPPPPPGPEPPLTASERSALAHHQRAIPPPKRRPGHRSSTPAPTQNGKYRGAADG